MTTGCAPDSLYLQFIAYLEAAAEQSRERLEAVTRQRDEANQEIARIENFEEFTAQLRRQVEAGHMPVEKALLELVPRKFNSAEFVSSLHEHSPRKRAS